MTTDATTTASPTDLLAKLRGVNELAAFNRWAGFEVAEATAGHAVLRMPWHEDLGQYFGHLHAGMISALIDTACGFAAATLVEQVAASHCAVTYLAPGVGSAFVATADVVKAGRRQVFTTAELHAEQADGTSRLVANGQTILVPLG
ncbi:MAG: hypothetical protein QOC54_3175 [Baekduia sp.]|nr:hypothetical protein [Baekduia sp.]